MDRKHFSDNSPGGIVQATNAAGQKDWAFVPRKMPPAWDFDPGLWLLVTEARDALGTLNGIGRTLPNPQLLLRPLQQREALASSSIEGTYVTPEQLVMYELDPKDPKSGDEQAADWREVFNYTKALRHGCALLQTLPLCNRLICEMHRILMEGSRGRSKSPGQFRNCQVQIGSAGRFLPPPAAEVVPLMNDLEQYMNTDTNEYDPLVRCFLVHYQFEAIHPFRDGNGRVGRALLALMIYSYFGHAMPWLYLSAFFEQYRDEYVSNLFKVSTDGDWSRWVEFCLRATIAQAEDSIIRCDRFKILREEFHQRIKSPSPRSHSIIEGLFSQPAVTVKTVQEEFKIAYNTARRDLERLAAVGILKETQESHVLVFYSQEIMKIAFEDHEQSESNRNEKESDQPADATPPSSSEPQQPSSQSQSVSLP